LPTASASGGRRSILAYFDEPTTNGYAEGVINKVKVLKRRATGCRRSRASASASS
jgi:transposase